MKNAKKILLLALSLVMLVGIFAVAALAEGTAEGVTVVYPDGATETFAVGEAIVPKAFVNDKTTGEDAKLYYGLGNTLYKDDATEGWLFTVEGADAALADLTVTAEMAGKKVIASGADKVYFTSYEQLSLGTTMVYHLTDDVVDYFTDNNLGDTGDGIHVGATAYGVAIPEKYTSNGVEKTRYLYSGDVLAVRGIVTKLTLTLYNDVEADAMTFCLGSNKEPVNKEVFFDLNGHNVTLGKTQGGYEGIDGIDLYLYSSQPGAHFTCTAATFFTPDDVTDFRLGDDGSGAYVDNIYFHVKTIFSTVYGSGHYIIGGHWYQLPGATGALLPIGRRIGAVRNAKFYVNDGSTILTDNPWEKSGVATGGTAIDSCSFYSFGTANLLSATKGATPKFTNCKFYNVTIPDAADVSDATNITGTATAKTASFLNGTTERYFADSETAAKAFVENHPNAKMEAPYDHYVGNEYYHIEEPAPVIEIDEAFNAVQKETSAGVRVFFTYTENDELFYVTDEATCGATLKALLTALPKQSDSDIKMYADISMEGSTVNGNNYYYRLDLNGYTLTLTSNGSDYGALDVRANKFFIYSSRKGGVIDASVAVSFIHSNDTTYDGTKYWGTAYVGERVADGTDYIGNLTVYCKTMTVDMHGTGIYYYGTTFVQSENSTASYFLKMGRTSGGAQIKAVKNCTFIVTNPNTAMLWYADSNSGGKTYYDCTFIYAGEGVVPLFATDNTTFVTNPKFLRCNFYNILPTKNQGGYAVDYTVTQNGTAYSCYFGFSGIAPSQDIDLAEETAAYIVRGAAEKTVVANGVSYVLNAEVSENRGVLVTFKDDQGAFGSENWIEGKEIVAPKELVRFDEANACMWRNPTCEITTDENGTTANVIWGLKDSFAFAYSNSKGVNYVYMSECGETATDVGDMFYALFAVPNDGYTITLYADMHLTKPMGFGPISKYSADGYNRDSYNSLAAGAITLDLNGTTVTIDESLVGINLTTANFKESTPNVQNAYKPAVFALECTSERFFTVKSSKAGAQIINNSNATIFGVGEGKSGVYKIEDAANNITVRSKGQIFAGIESYGNTIYRINGGTYIYEGTTALATLSRGTVLENATFICTQTVGRVFYADGYRISTFTATNCTFYSATGASILAKYAGESSQFASADISKSSRFTFTNCSFVNVALTEKLSVTYKVNKTDEVATTFSVFPTYAGAVVSSAEDLALAYKDADLTGLVMAYSGKTVNGETYKLMGYYADGTALVNWGFGITETWVIGETAMHEETVIDGVFGYAFDSFKVTEGANNAVATLVAYKPGTLQMSLTLQSKIGLNVFLTEALADATVKIGDKTYVLAELLAADGYYKLEEAIAPNAANGEILITVLLNGNTHVVPVSVGAYAEVLLADAQYADAHALTYAMVEYVRVMTEDAEFLANVEAPAGYETQTLAAAPSGNTAGLLESIAFQLDDTIAIALQGTSEANGMEVTLKLATGHVETATVENKKAIFEGLYVNEFYGEMTITIGGETYTYSLANYLNGLTNADAKAGVQALYNYAYYAEEYVTALQNAQ